MKTNTKIIKDQVRKYIFENLAYPSEIGYEGYQDNDTERLRMLRDEFNRTSVYDRNLNVLGSYDKCFVDFLQGMPSVFNYECWVNETVKILENWGLKQPENKDDIDSFDLYNHLITREFKALLKLHGLEYIL